MLQLLVAYDFEEYLLPLPEGESTLGRASTNDIVVRAKGVSRVHARLRRRQRSVELSDLGSKNGLLVEGQKLGRVILTPGLRVQIGTAWLAIEEVSAPEDGLVPVVERLRSRAHSPHSYPPTATADPEHSPQRPSPTALALTLAYHVDRAGVGFPGHRIDLLLRIKAALEAEALVTFERSQSGKVRLRERVGEFSYDPVVLLVSLVRNPNISSRDQTVLKRAGSVLLAGRDPWFLGVEFPTEDLARESWRRDFLAFLASQFFRPVKKLKDIEANEVLRVFLLTGENLKRTAELLGSSRGTVYALLKQFNLPRPRRH